MWNSMNTKWENKKDLNRKIRNIKCQLNTLKCRRAYGGEATEAFEYSPLSQLAMEFVIFLDDKIKKKEKLLKNLENELKRKNT